MQVLELKSCISQIQIQLEVSLADKMEDRISRLEDKADVIEKSDENKKE
jgi:hypothetical protein